MAHLNSPIKEEVNDLIFNKGIPEYRKGNHLGFINCCNEAWSLFPEPKYIYDESYTIALYLTEVYIELKNFEKAKEWSEIIYQCDLERVDSGARDFLAGRVAFESGDLETAKKRFKIANEKSEGRCFIDQDKKYLKFFVKNK